MASSVAFVIFEDSNVLSSAESQPRSSFIRTTSRLILDKAMATVSSISSKDFISASNASFLTLGSAS